MAKKVKVIVAGSRSFTDLDLLRNKCDYYLSDAIARNYDIEIVSGTAKGADKLGEAYALEKGYHIAFFPADWKTHGKRGGYLRNQQMADYANDCGNGALICFWDGQSKGTAHMIDIAKQKGMHIRIVRYHKE